MTAAAAAKNFGIGGFAILQGIVKLRVFYFRFFQLCAGWMDMADLRGHGRSQAKPDGDQNLPKAYHGAKKPAAGAPKGGKPKGAFSRCREDGRKLGVSDI
ncbi:MAG: hypothetical protein FJ145_00460 [Deltaproteobacteria bacterium]|nr:hypothetical protein [Deltaproteobacteria bacterium]